MSFHCVLEISPIRAPVSFRSCRSVEVLFEPADIRESMSFSVGINGRVDSLLYFGCVHVLPINLKYPL